MSVYIRVYTGPISFIKISKLNLGAKKADMRKINCKLRKCK